MERLSVNGINCLYEHKDTPICSVRIMFNAGSMDEDEDIYGAAHFLEHMFFKGTKNKTYKQLNKELTQLGTYNASTGPDKTMYYIDCLTEDWQKSLRLLEEMIFENEYAQKEFDKEQGVILEECQTCLDSPSNFFWMNVEPKTFSKKMHSVIGTKESISAMTVKKLNDFKNKFYNSCNMVVVIMGKVDKYELTKELRDMSEKYGKELFETGIRTKKHKLEVTNNEDDFFDHKSEQAHIAYFFPVMNLEEKKKYMAVAEIFECAFGDSSYSMLFDELREKLGLCYSVGYNEFYYRGNPLSCITMQLDSKNVVKARKKIDEVIDRVKKKGFSKTAIDTAKKNCIFKVSKLLQTSSGLAASCYNYFSLGVFDLEKYVEDLKKVNNSDIIEYANIALGNERKFLGMNVKVVENELSGIMTDVKHVCKCKGGKKCGTK